MKKIYFTVGPSQVYPNLDKHIIKAIDEDILSLNHRGEVFKKLFASTTSSLKKLMNIPNDYQIFFVSSALESMEKIIQSTVEKTSFHIISGNFGKNWAKFATQLGKEVLKYEAVSDIDLTNLRMPKKAETICITQNDTSTGVWIPVKEIYQLKETYPEKLIAIDIVSSAPYVDIDFKFIDVAFFSVQKGFGLPAGLGVIIVSPNALEKCEKLFKKGVKIGSYHSFKTLSEKALDFQTPETPNVLNIYLLEKVTKDMIKKGLPKIRKEINQKANVLYNFFDSHKKYSPFIKDKKYRSPTTLVLDVAGDSEVLRKKLAKKGFLVGAGYGEQKLNQIRIANFPSHKIEDVKKMLKYME